MTMKKILFIDRDGTLIEEPAVWPVDSLDKLVLKPGVIPALLKLQAEGYSLVMVSNQEGLGTSNFSQADFLKPQQFMLELFSSQGIIFDAIHICPHRPEDKCDCRMPKLGLVLPYLTEQTLNREHSLVIGCKEADREFAKNMGIQGLFFGSDAIATWDDIVRTLLKNSRVATVSRKTKETAITATVDLDSCEPIDIDTGIGFFDHMLEQLAKHGGFSLSLSAKGDLHIDEHHTVEDVAIVIGEALKSALGDKLGINRYGFLLPMDEASTQIALDLSGRSYFVFEGKFSSDRVGEFSTELVPHFFRSMADGLKATLHIKVEGENTHHMVESIFKGVGRSLRQAITRVDSSLPSTKGVL